jgi:phage protein
MKKENFENLYNIDLKKYIEKDYKGLSYLSWATAYKIAMEKDPTMTYQVYTDADGLPFFSRGNVHFVKTRIVMFGEIKEMMLPVMDNKHNAVTEPNSRQINDNIMRCLVKNLAMFGLGLSLYIKEDLQEIIAEDKKDTKEKKIIQEPILPKDKMISKLIDLPKDKMMRMLGHFKAKNIFQMTEEQVKEAYQKVFIN